MFGLVMLFGSIVAESADSAFSVQQFENNPIAFVEKIGETQIVNDNWNILVYYDLKNYFDEFYAIHEGVAQLEKKCSDTGYDCSVVATLKHRLDGIEDNNEILLSDRDEIRPKRQLLAALGFGGLAMGGGALYSWLTSSDADKYAKQIDELKSNQALMADKLEKQTTVIEKMYDCNNQTLREINALTCAAKDDRQMQGAALKYSNMLNSFAATQNSIIDAVLTVHNGNLHPSLIPPRKMRQQIAFIANQLGPEFELPKTLKNVYQMANVKARFVKDKLIFRVAIPVLKTTRYQMWRIIPMPRAVNQIYMEIRPTTEYLLVNDKNDTFYDLTKLDFNACSDIDDELVCRIRHPSYTFGDSVDQCELGLIRNATSNHTNCQMEPVTLKDKWTQLNDIHSWIFVLDGEKSFNVSCDDFIKTITLSGMGLLNLNGNCSFEGDNMQISTNELQTRMITGYSVSANFSSSFNFKQAINNVRINTTELDMAMQDLKKSSAQKLLNISVHDWHQYGVIYGFILAVALCYFIRRQKKPKTDDIHINQIIAK